MGTAACNAEGSAYAECLGSVLPSFQSCATGVDTNCDGAAACSGAHQWSQGLIGQGEKRVIGLGVDKDGNIAVAGVETVWGGVEVPPYGGPIVVKDYRGQGIVVERFAEMARFNYGSTVIVLLPEGVATLDQSLRPQGPVKLGERLATLVG